MMIEIACCGAKTYKPEVGLEVVVVVVVVVDLQDGSE